MKFTNRQGKIRLYDGAGTPFYLEMIFDKGDLTAPLGTPRQEETLVLDRGVMDSNAHYIKGADDKLMEPVEISFSGMIEDTSITENLLDWLEQMQNGDSASPPQSSGTVNAHTLTSTKEDTQRDGSNNNPAFRDGKKLTCNLEYKLDGAADLVWHYYEIWFPLAEQSITESDEGVDIALKGYVYGTITRDSAFSAGTDVSA